MNAKNIYDERKMIIDAFKNEIFPMVPTGFSEDEASTSSSESRRSSESTRSSSEENVSGKITTLDKYKLIRK